MCDMPYSAWTPDADEDWNLIAAAPDMLELLETIENDTGMVPEWLWERIQSVVNRAKSSGDIKT